jgi:gamma-glutamylcyclotransferase (GGCT)/AIG2-like uncharacterized protein YtfP
VQLAKFGRRLEGEPDAARGFAATTILIEDPETVALSGSDRHLIMTPTGDPDDAVEGMVFRLSSAELEAADAYEAEEYVRVAVPLRSGRTAWAYVSAA